jgi:hypothetical protein
LVIGICYTLHPCLLTLANPPPPHPHLPTHPGSGRASPAAALASANPALITRRPGSDTGSPLGRYGAVGSPSSHGAASIGAAAEEALAAKMSAAAITTRDLGPGVGDQGAMLPPGWAKVTDGQGLVYYVNHVTQEVGAVRAPGGGGGGGRGRLGGVVEQPTHPPQPPPPPPSLHPLCSLR